MDIFSALADANRRQIIEMLAASGQLSASDISDRFKVSPPAISQHLKVLREAKLVEMEKKAQQRMYKINPSKIQELENWARRMRLHWEEKFKRLDQLLAKESEVKRHE